MESKKRKTGGEAANTFSLPFVTQKEAGCGVKPHEVKAHPLVEAASKRSITKNTRQNLFPLVLTGCVFFYAVLNGAVKKFTVRGYHF